MLYLLLRMTMYQIMKVEEILKSMIPMDNSKKVIPNSMYTQSVITENFNDVIKPYEISGEQYNVLRMLRGQKGNPANMCVVQERMLAKTSNTTRLVDKLLLKEYVTRKVYQENSRKIEVLITQKGLDVLAVLNPKVIAHEQLFFRKFTSRRNH
jgi:DNA-binding MarR family transcriptional regulator